MKRNKFKNYSLWFSSFLIILFATNNCSLNKISSAPVYFEPVAGKYEIPEDYETYTLFFATSYTYVESLSKNDMRELKKHIKRFGKSIGGKNLAVWVRNPDKDTLNVELGKTYTDRLYTWYKMNLDYSDGPYLVFLTHHPDSLPNENDFAAVISFSNKTKEYIVEAIEYLEAQIRRGKVSQHGVIAVNYWLDFKSLVAKNKTILKEIIMLVSENAFNKANKRLKKDGQ